MDTGVAEVRRRGRSDAVEDLFSSSDADRSSGRMLRLARETWPSQERFPVNHASASVGRLVSRDLVSSSQPLVVTGFASIGELIDLIGDWAAEEHVARMRVVLGSEPFRSHRLAFGSPTAQFTDEVRRYWLETEGISLRLSAKILQVKEALRDGQVDVRHVPGAVRLHAKIYVAQDAVTLGSSNFTGNGLRAQLEGNVRFQRVEDRGDYDAAATVAENYWSDAQPWNDEFEALLDAMLQVVTWREALARAAADLLEGQWVREYLTPAQRSTALWPSQVAGIAEALWVVENVGSVLIADATGSGKTRMGAYLTRAVRDRLWSTGRVRSDLTVLVSPPAVKDPWMREAVNCGLTVTHVSHGKLSHTDRDGPGTEETAVAGAQILAVDEAHNFLSQNSNRTRALRASAADHVLLFTATPINRGAADLLSLIDLLGADNFDDDTLDILDQLERAGGQVQLKPHQQEQLRTEIQRFTVRRTKTELNTLVERQPEAYRHPSSGRVCRYPEHDVRTYHTGETASDAELARRIRELAGALLGVTYLGNRLSVPASLSREYSDEQWLQLRLSSAKGLAAHHITSAMRSSRAALLEHLLGTSEALALSQLDASMKQQPTGNLLGKTRAAGDQDRPQVDLTCDLPEWLASDDYWKAACEAETLAYEAIAEAARQLSTAREEAKAAQILHVATAHALVLAFDRHPITLAAIQPFIDADDLPVIVATGSNQSGKKKVKSAFRRESEDRGVALCSDAMSEGLNLQGASAVLHLDLPTTLRTAEQRVGRVDRMDSPHDRIEAWWPIDGPAFAVRTDELLTARAAESAALLGSNLPIPTLRDSDLVDIEQHARTLEESRVDDWDGLHDALAPVRDLVAGPRAIVPAQTYAEYRNETSRIVARVSPLRTRTPWAFIAVSARLRGAPRWMLLEATPSTVTVGLSDVVDRLRLRLEEDPQPRALDHDCETWLNNFLTQAEKSERELLPRRIQRALHQMQNMTRHWSEKAFARGAYDEAERWRALAHVAQPAPDDELRPDPHDAAERWLRLVQPLIEQTRQQRRRRYSRLRDIDPLLRTTSLDLATVEDVFAGIEATEPFSHRISACILGVPDA